VLEPLLHGSTSGNSNFVKMNSKVQRTVIKHAQMVFYAKKKEESQKDLLPMEAANVGQVTRIGLNHC
jgi:hypothetical protein